MVLCQHFHPLEMFEGVAPKTVRSRKVNSSSSHFFEFRSKILFESFFLFLIYRSAALRCCCCLKDEQHRAQHNRGGRRYSMLELLGTVNNTVSIIGSSYNTVLYHYYSNRDQPQTFAVGASWKKRKSFDAKVV